MTYWIAGVAAWLAFWCAFVGMTRRERERSAARAAPWSLFDDGDVP